MLLFFIHTLCKPGGALMDDGPLWVSPLSPRSWSQPLGVGHSSREKWKERKYGGEWGRASLPESGLFPHIGLLGGGSVYPPTDVFCSAVIAAKIIVGASTSGMMSRDLKIAAG